MLTEITSEKFWKLYQTLPQELKDALSAEATGKQIEDICNKNGALEKVEEVVDIVTQVLIGFLPPDEFQLALGKELKLDSEMTRKIAREINRYIFYPVKTSLEELYGKEIMGPAKPSGITPPPSAKAEEKAERDIYREPIE